MKIIYFSIVELELPGGPTVHTLNMLKGLKQAGAEARLVCPKPSNAISGLPVEADYLPFWGFSPFRFFVFDLVAFIILVGVLIRHRPDVLMIRELENSFSGFLAGRLCGVNVVLELNGFLPIDEIVLKSKFPDGRPVRYAAWKMWWLKMCRNAWRRFVFSMSDAVVANTPRLRNVLCEEFHFPLERTLVLTMAVDTALFKPLSREVCVQQISVPKEKLVIGYVGSFQPTHELESVFNAWEWLRDQGHDVIFLLVGKGCCYDEILSKYQTHRYRDSLTFAGWVPHEMIPIYMNMMNVGVALMKPIKTYAAESLLKFKEYIACGVPVIVNGDHALFAELPPSTMILVDSLTPEHLGRKMLEAMAALRKRSEGQVPAIIEDRYSLRAVAGTLLDWLARLQRKKGHSCD